MRRNAGLSVIEILIIIVCICAVVLFLGVGFRPRYERAKIRCTSNLRSLGTAMHLYLIKYGDQSCFPEPANAFRGDCFLAILYWKDIVQESKGMPGNERRRRHSAAAAGGGERLHRHRHGRRRRGGVDLRRE